MTDLVFETAPQNARRPQQAAPPLRRVLAQGRFEAGVLMRNGEQLMVTILIPIVILIGLGAMSVVSLETDGHTRIDTVSPQVIAFCVMSGAFTGQAIMTAFDRRNGVLRLLGTTPLGPGGLVAGKVVAVIAIEILQVAVVGATALLLGWRPDVAGLPAAILAGLLGAIAFTAFALFLAGTLRAEAVIAAANLLLLGLAALGGLFIPAAQFPPPLRAIAGWLPSGALDDAFRVALTNGSFPFVPLAILVGWAALFSLGAVRKFRWH